MVLPETMQNFILNPTIQTDTKNNKNHTYSPRNRRNIMVTEFRPNKPQTAIITHIQEVIRDSYKSMLELSYEKFRQII